MKRVAVAMVLLLAAIGSTAAQTLSITGPSRNGMLEGETYDITWYAEGLRSVTVVVYGTKTPLGTALRGRFTIIVSKPVPAENGIVRWTVPWIDSIAFGLKIKGYDDLGQLRATDERTYRFRPAVMADRLADGIYIALHRRSNQRLYVQRNQRITRAYLCSSSQNYRWVPAGVHPSTPHDHYGVFKVQEKTTLHWSNEYQLPMPYALRYHGGHFIHATSRNMYRYLGRPASHGCNRLTRHDAMELFKMTPVGTRVEVIGPGG